jgi:hypothetical protein
MNNALLSISIALLSMGIASLLGYGTLLFTGTAGALARFR